jgi:hypothetical protein
MHCGLLSLASSPWPEFQWAEFITLAKLITLARIPIQNGSGLTPLYPKEKSNESTTASSQVVPST